MARRVLVIQGHPDPRGGHFGHALADAYAQAAAAAGHAVRRIEVAQLDVPVLRSQAEWSTATAPGALGGAQDDIRWAEHLVVIFPLWQGTMPALLKAFFEQVLRPGFAVGAGASGAPRQGLAGKSARLVVTMGMPAFWYRWFFLAHGVRGFARNALAFCGVKPVRQSLIGLVEAPDGRARARWLGRMGEFGRKAA
jgi:putative NADPH-quinone reductase